MRFPTMRPALRAANRVLGLFTNRRIAAVMSEGDPDEVIVGWRMVRVDPNGTVIADGVVSPK